MMRKHVLTKKDLAVALACITFLLANLAAIGTGGRRRAKEALCLSNLRQWAIIWEMFIQQNDGQFIDTPYWTQDATLTDLYKGISYRDAMQLVVDKYPGLSPEARSVKIRQVQYDQNKIRFCPLAKKTPEEGGRHPNMAFFEDNETGSYLLNLWATSAEGNVRELEMLWQRPEVKDAGKAPLFMDGSSEPQNVCPQMSDTPPPYEGAPQWSNDNEMNRVCINRHQNGAINMLFVDSSVRKVGLKELWRLKWHRKWTAPTIPVWPEWMENFKDYSPYSR